MPVQQRSLGLDCLRRIQSTLTRRAAEYDPEYFVSIGFAPSKQHGRAAHDACLPFVAQIDVRQKQIPLSSNSTIRPVERVRLFNRNAQRYEQLRCYTDVRPVDRVVPTGVSVTSGIGIATTSIVVRWSTLHPAPPMKMDDDGAEDPNWHWGLVTVAHLFKDSAGESTGSQRSARVRRLTDCGNGPRQITGRLVARGRVPGGPDIALLETGLQRLWLSGFLPRLDLEPIATAEERDLMRWTTHGTQGSFVGHHNRHAWRWQSFYPELSIQGLGKLKGIVRYDFVGPEREMDLDPFGPGASGGVLLAGGIPIGIQVAAMEPHYRVGFAQTFWSSIPWLTKRLGISKLVIVNVLP